MLDWKTSQTWDTVILRKGGMRRTPAPSSWPTILSLETSHRLSTYYVPGNGLPNVKWTAKMSTGWLIKTVPWPTFFLAVRWQNVIATFCQNDYSWLARCAVQILGACLLKKKKKKDALVVWLGWFKFLKQGCHPERWWKLSSQWWLP